MFSDNISVLEGLPILERVVILLTFLMLVPVLSNKIKIPPMVGFILAGIIMGPSILNISQKGTPLTSSFAEIGKILILFYAGLEIDFAQFAAKKWRSVLFGLLTFSVPLVLVTFIALSFNYSLLSSILIGSLLASHTLLAFPILQKYDIVKKESVIITVGATMITDILALIVLALCISVHTIGFSPKAFTIQITQIILFIVFILIVLNRVVHWVLSRVKHSSDFALLMPLLIVSVTSVLADIIHLEPIVGAFLAGLAINECIEGQRSKQFILDLGNTILIPIFFFSIGVIINIRHVQDIIISYPLLSMAMLFALLSSKFIAAWITGMIFKYPKNEILNMWSITLPQVAATLAAALVASEAMNSLGEPLIDGKMLSIILLLVFFSSLAGPILTKHFSSKHKHM